MAGLAAECYPGTMNLLVLSLILLFSFGGFSLYLAGPAIGGEVVGVILLMGGIIYWVGGFRSKI
jgi:hypothetical protein